MDCCQCQSIEKIFDERQTQKDLKSYQNTGCGGSTRILVKAIKAEGIENVTVLDIGGGVGAIQHELLDAGARETVDVDASTGYIEVARGEAERHGYLDRVICCYHDAEKLVGLSSMRAKTIYGVVFPRDNWISRAVICFGNLYMWLRRTPFRAFIHPTSLVDSLVTNNGLRRRFYRKTLAWQIVVYIR